MNRFFILAVLSFAASQTVNAADYFEGSMGGDDGIRRVMEMVCAATRE